MLGRNGGGALIAFPNGTRRLRITAPTDMKTFGTGQNLLVDLLPAVLQPQGYASTFGSPDALNVPLTYLLSPRTTATLPP